MTRSLRRLIYACFLLATTAAPSAHAATLGATLTAVLDQDVDLSNTITCGDYLRYRLTLSNLEFPPAAPPAGALFDIEVDSNILFEPTSVTASPGATVTFTDPLRLTISFGTVTDDLTASWRGQIRNLNTGVAVSLQGEVTGTNFPLTLTDDPAAAGLNPTVTPYVPCPPTPVVRATKTWSLLTDLDGDGLADPGDTIRYTVLLNNASVATASGATFTSPLDAESTLVVGSVTTTRGAVTLGNAAGNTSVGVNLGNLPPSTTTTIRFDARIRPTTLALQLLCQGSITASNLAAVVRTDDPTTPTLNDPTRTPIDRDPDLAVSKTDGGTSVQPSNTVTYTVTARNLSPTPAANVLVAERIPLHSTFEPTSSDGRWSCPSPNAGAPCTLALGSLAPNATADLAFTVRAAAAIPLGVSELRNTASITSPEPDPDPTNNTATDTTPLSGLSVDLAITKDDGGLRPAPSELLVYRLVVRNLGNVVATDVDLTETVPVGTTFAAGSSDPRWSCTGTAAGSTCHLVLRALDAQQQLSLLYAVQLDSTFPVNFVAVDNTVVVTDDGQHGPDTDPTNNTASISTPVSALAATLNIFKNLVVSNPVPGGLLAWDLVVSNDGNIATPALLHEVVPDGTTWDSASSDPRWNCVSDAAGTPCTLAAGIINAGAQTTVRYAVRIDDILPANIVAITNCARVTTADQAAGRASQQCNTVPLTLAIDLRLTKDDHGADVLPGAVVSYDLRAENASAIALTNVVLTETVPLSTTFDATASDPSWVCAAPSAGSTCALAVGPLAAQTSATYTFAVRADATAAPNSILTNTATATDDGRRGADINPTNNTATDTTPVAEPAPTVATLALTKRDAITQDSGTAGFADSGDVITYTVVLRNAGPAPATGVKVRPFGLDPQLRLRVGTVTTTAGTVIAGNNSGDIDVAIDVAALAVGATLTITYEVDVLDLAPTTTEVSCQLLAVADQSDVVASDDPDTPALFGDPTSTPVAPRVEPPPLTPTIPTLGTWGLIALVASITFAALRFLRGATHA